VSFTATAGDGGRVALRVGGDPRQRTEPPHAPQGGTEENTHRALPHLSPSPLFLTSLSPLSLTSLSLCVFQVGLDTVMDIDEVVVPKGLGDAAQHVKQARGRRRAHGQGTAYLPRPLSSPLSRPLGIPI